MAVLRMFTCMALLALPFTAPAADPATAGSPESVDRRAPELTDIIADFSKRTGRRFNVDPRVRAVLNLVGIDPDRITYSQLLATFAIHQFASYEQDGVIVVVPDTYARQLPTRIYTDVNFKADDNEWVTLLLAPKKACAPQLVPILRPLMPQAAHLAADPQSGSLVLVDHAANVRRIAELVAKIDQSAGVKAGCAQSSGSGS